MVAIVGRPNVGKSSLVNMIAGAKLSIVDDAPGVTRDRVSAIVDLRPTIKGGRRKTIELIDTGGYGVYVAEGARYDEVGNDLATLTGDIERQIGEAVSSADVVLFCVDCQAGVTPADEEIARKLREGKFGTSGRAGPAPIVQVVATKCDGPAWEAHAYEIASLGFGEPLACSAKSNYFRREFLDGLWEIVPEREEEPEAQADLKVAIIGKRNAGKSTLVNALAGQERVIVSEIPGTTRDAIDVRFELDGKSVLAIDTAGLRRKKAFQSGIEWYALDRAERAIGRSDVVLMLVDATVPVSQVDEHLAQMVQRSFKPAVLIVNKWDLVEGRYNEQGKPITPEDYEAYLRKELKGLAIAPIVFMSAATGLHVREAIGVAFDLLEQSRSRVGTGELNRLIGSIMATRGPSSKLGTFAKVFFATQAAVQPPTIVLVVNRPELFTPNYQRYLLNRLRESLPFEEVPIRLVVKGRSRSERRTNEELATAAAAEPVEGFDQDVDELFEG